MKLVLLLLPLFVTAAAAQQADEPVRYGLLLGLNINFHSADFQQLPGYPNCCPEFRGGAGAGPVGAAVVDIPLLGALELGLRVGYFGRSGTLRESQSTTVLVDGRETEATFEHVIDATIATVAAELLAGYRATEALRLHVGARAGAVVASSFAQREELTKPEGVGTFENGLRVRNDTSDAIPGAESFNAALAAGISVELPLNRSRTLVAAPELMFSFDLTDISTEVDWRTSALRLGVAVKSGRAAEPEVPIATSPPQPNAPQASLAVVASGVDASGVEHGSVVVRVEEFISTNMRPLLNYLFFDEGSSALPDRYVRLEATSRTTFDVSALHSLGPLETYHHVLNILGSRMRSTPGAVTITGCTGGPSDVGERADLAHARAAAISDYLVTTWGVDPQRIRTETRGLPAVPSDTSIVDGRAENRRVEITSDNPALLEPVITADTLRQVDPPVLRFRPQLTDASPRRWRIDVTQRGTALASFNGVAPLPAKIDWAASSNQLSIPRGEDPVDYRMMVEEESGTSLSAAGSLPLELVTIRRKREERAGDKIIDRYRMILFDFDRSELTAANRATADLIHSHISDDAVVTITGHTDRIGEGDHNRQLSQARALETARALGVAAERAIGIGEEPLLYDNDLPEGRFYSRTVEVLVETPVR